MDSPKAKRETSQAFSSLVSSRLGGETMLLCYQCGTCASSCPVAKITPNFNPREVIRLSLLGEKEEVLSGETIWLCCSCYNCQERCPQKVEVADLIYTLRNIAFEKGYTPDIYSQFASALLEEGRIVKVSKFVENKRPAVGLPPLQPTGIEAMRKILSTSKFKKPQQKKEEDR